MASQQKIGVLTFHRCINYGSYWQARCLVEGLRARGHDAVLLDHHSRRVDRVEWKCALQPTLPTPVPPSDRALYRRKMCKFFAAFETLPLSPPFALEQPDAMESYDTIVVGSDEVWNLCHPWFGGCELFYGKNLRAEKLVSYAASFGNYDASAGLEERFARHLRSFASISVRDENSFRIVQGARVLAPQLVLDPCLQFPPPIEGEWNGPNQPFIAVYGHNFSPAFAQHIRRAAHERGFQLVSVGYRNDWADIQWLDAGPHDFAHAIARAQAVATNFFHGCVFALNNEKPFACETSFYRSHKVSGLMKTVGGEKHLVSQNAPSAIYDTLLHEPIEAQIFRNIEALRHASQAYLDFALA